MPGHPFVHQTGGSPLDLAFDGPPTVCASTHSTESFSGFLDEFELFPDLGDEEGYSRTGDRPTTASRRLARS